MYMLKIGCYQITHSELYSLIIFSELTTLTNCKHYSDEPKQSAFLKIFLKKVKQFKAINNYFFIILSELFMLLAHITTRGYLVRRKNTEYCFIQDGM